MDETIQADSGVIEISTKPQWLILNSYKLELCNDIMPILCRCPHYHILPNLSDLVWG